MNTKTPQLVFFLVICFWWNGCDFSERVKEMFGKTELQKTLEYWQASGGDLSAMIHGLGEYPIKKKKDVQAITTALKTISLSRNGNSDGIGSSLHALTALFQRVQTNQAVREFVASGLPELRRILEEGLQNPNPEWNVELLFILEVLAMYSLEEDARLVVEIAQQGFLKDNYLWSDIFGAFDGGHPHWLFVVDRLGMRLPDDFMGVAFLDAVNSLALEGHLGRHPFDTAEGREKLKQRLLNKKEENFSYAVSAAAALAFLTPDGREELIDIAGRHPETRVRLECAWALARIGDDRGVARLKLWCVDINYGVIARHYLEELGMEKEIPPEALDEDFVSMAEMSRWLSHPHEFGRPPDELVLVDKRVLFWPPTEDERTVWLFKYTYNSTEEDEEVDIGLGMVGSITFALFGETTKDLSPEEAYALHCCWELEMYEDPRAPRKRTIEAGLKILKEDNSETFKDF